MSRTGRESDPAASGERPLALTRRLVWALATAQAVLFASLGFARFTTFHNETFDLAFYTRIAWGLVHQQFWEPMVNAHVYGLHLSPVLVPLGALGALLGTAPVLIVGQAIAIAAAVFPLARIGTRHLGGAGALAGALAWLFYPTLGHVAGYEVHPGAIATLPLAWLAYAIDRGNARVFAISAVGVLACREDLALVVTMAAVVFGWRHRARWRAAAFAFAFALGYALFFFLVVHPRFAPAHGSLQLHFGRFGNSTSEVALYFATHPGALVGHLATPARLAYLPKILAPLGLLTLLRPSWLLPALPVLAINLVSEWPTTLDLDVHYLTPAVPFLVAGALEGAGRVRHRAATLALLVVPTAIAHLLAGGTPLALDFERAAYRRDANSEAARRIVDAIPPAASVQAPYPFLAHVAERPLLHRASSPEANARFLVLDVAHRQRFAAREDLLRTIEEPITRAWLARGDHAVVDGGADYLLLERGRSPREGRGGDAIVGTADPDAGERIAACLALLDARLDDSRPGESRLVLEFVARDACPSDLALRIGTAYRPRRVDLLFAGWLSPAQLRRGDRVRSVHVLTPSEVRAIRARGLRVGALRSSGARPEHADPMAIDVALR